MNFPGHPVSEPSAPAETHARTFQVTFDDERDQKGAYLASLIDADYLIWRDGLVSFWEKIEGGDHDGLVVAYPIRRIREIDEQ